MLERVILSADVVASGVGLPLENAGVVVSQSAGQGSVVAFGKLAALQQQFPEARTEHVGRAILPAAVNAHTHLDMTRIPFRALPYPRWIPEVAVANRAQRGPDAAREGVAQLLAAGVRVVGDIVYDQTVMETLLQTPGLSGVAYWEVLGMNPQDAPGILKTTAERIRHWRTLERPGGVRLGLSPHAPTTVSHVLLQGLARLAQLEDLPMQIHVAEHPSECEWFATGGGDLAAAFARANAPDATTIWGRAPDPALTPVQHLADLGVLAAKPSLVHMVNVTENDVQTVAQTGCVVVTCPRSNHNLDCGVFPWALYARHGVEVALGTDSVASGETLNIFEEAQAALGYLPGVGLRQVVRWLSQGGHRALRQKPPVVKRGDAVSQLTVWP